MCGVRQGLSLSRIAASIGRDKSVVSREVRRNRAGDGEYYAAIAHAQAYRNARRPKPFKLVGNPRLGRLIERWMDDGWSPGLIADVLRRDYGDDQVDAGQPRNDLPLLVCADPG